MRPGELAEAFLASGFKLMFSRGEDLMLFAQQLSERRQVEVVALHQENV